MLAGIQTELNCMYLCVIEGLKEIIMKKFIVVLIMLLSFTGLSFANETYSLQLNGTMGKVNTQYMFSFDGTTDYGLSVDYKCILGDFAGLNFGIGTYLLIPHTVNEIEDLFLMDLYIGIAFMPYNGDNLTLFVSPLMGLCAYTNNLLYFLGFDDDLDADFFSFWIGGEVNAVIKLTREVGIDAGVTVEYTLGGIGDYLPFAKMNRWACYPKVGISFNF